MTSSFEQHNVDLHSILSEVKNDLEEVERLLKQIESSERLNMAVNQFNARVSV